MARMSPWALPADFEELCMKALLLCGEIPASGYRTYDGVRTIWPTTREGKEHRQKVVEFFWDLVWERYEDKGYTTYFLRNLSLNYTNRFMQWAREQQKEILDGPQDKDA